MEEHLTAGQIAEFILGGLDDDELDEVYRHVDLCGELVGGRVAATSESRERGESCAVAGSLKTSKKTFLTLSRVLRSRMACGRRRREPRATIHQSLSISVKIL